MMDKYASAMPVILNRFNKSLAYLQVVWNKINSAPNNSYHDHTSAFATVRRVAKTFGAISRFNKSSWIIIDAAQKIQSFENTAIHQTITTDPNRLIYDFTGIKRGDISGNAIPNSN